MTAHAFEPAGHDRLLELLAARALDGLDAPEVEECDRLLRDRPELDDDSMDLAAAALEVAFAGRDRTALPAALRARCETTGRRWVESRRDRYRSAASRPVRTIIAPARPATAQAGAVRRRRPTIAAIAGWSVAAALLAFVGAMRWADPPREAGPPTAEAQRTALLESGAPLIRWNWSPAAHPRVLPHACGDVVFSAQTQEGYLEIAGLAPNDPGEVQYQLWIFDRTRDEAYPVDGGVFDIPADCAAVTVPIRPAIAVREPALFAVTVEPPGGVVVSKREIVLLAQP